VTSEDFKLLKVDEQYLNTIDSVHPYVLFGLNIKDHLTKSTNTPMASRTALTRLARAPTRFTSSPTSSLRFAQSLRTRSLQRLPIRLYSTESSTEVHPPDYLNESERQIFEKLKSSLQPSKLEVQDISGGCGSMYGLDIVSAQFKGLSVIKQHRMVNQILGEEIKKWHGVQLKTKAP
jgi:stress-induced morphogen